MPDRGGGGGLPPLDVCMYVCMYESPLPPSNIGTQILCPTSQAYFILFHFVLLDHHCYSLYFNFICILPFVFILLILF